MQRPEGTTHSTSFRVPWNKGKFIGAKPPLRTKHVWSIHFEGRKRDLAMFNLAIDSKLSGCDVVSLRVEIVAPHGITVDRATVRPKKTGMPVRFELSEHRRTGNLRAVQLLLGHTKIESTVRYLGIEVDDALAISEQVEV
jgi:hypothetical protein